MLDVVQKSFCKKSLGVCRRLDSGDDAVQDWTNGGSVIILLSIYENIQQRSLVGVCVHR